MLLSAGDAQVVINVVLVVLGFVLALAPFSGNVLDDPGKPPIQRITVRGWIVLVCLICALGLGIAKECLASQAASRAAAEAARAQAGLQKQLTDAAEVQNELRTNLLASKNDLAAVREQLRVANEQLAKMPKEIDYPFYETIGPRDGVVRSATNQQPLLVYGGEVIDYEIHGDGAKNPELISFQIGARNYRVNATSGLVRAIADDDNSMPVRLVYPSDLTFAMKMALRSTARSEIAAVVNGSNASKK
jgi:hypothetical protein